MDTEKLNKALERTIDTLIASGGDDWEYNSKDIELIVQYAEKQLKQSNVVQASEATAILPHVSNSLKAIELTHEEAKQVNNVIRDKEDVDGEIVGYLLEVLMKIEQQYPDIKS